MANNRTINLLPQVFRTDTNKKFLNATLDQLVSDPEFIKVDGYIGRKFAPTAKSNDYYLSESTALRQNYQLEPSVVIKNKSGDTEFFGNYIDLLQQIQYHGGIISNQDRLFNNKGYSYTGLFDLDKFVNFNQYYWLPDGPGGAGANVPVTSGSVPITETIVVTRDTTTGSYKFSSNGQALNPEIAFAHGGSYNFIVNQPGFPFWIQTETGTAGTRLNQPNTSSRDVLGVINNGLDVGTVTFNVPLPDAQNVYNQFTLAFNVDVAVDIPYRDLQGTSVADIEAAGGLDGITGNLENKKVIFVGGPAVQDDFYWTDATTVGATPVPEVDRYTVWTIRLVDAGNGVQTVNLVNPQAITPTQKVFVRSGIYHANSEYFISSVGDWSPIPVNTASLSFLFYQDGSSSTMTGRIKLVSNDGTIIDIDDQVLGKTYYKSPNGVEFTNGLRITFDTQVTPSSYANKVYFVEGVGTGIRLVPAEEFDSTTFTEPQYITINRASLDKNSWSRNNCWFHIDTIRAAEGYLGISPQDGIAGNAGITNQTAFRPIIEFNPDLQLFNNGIVGIADVDTFDVDQITNAFMQVEGAPALYDVDIGWYFMVDSTTFPVGAETDRIIFSADPDPLVTNKIFNMQVVDLNENPENPDYVIHLSEVESVAVGTVVLTKRSFTSSVVSTNLYYWFDGSIWTRAQQKTKSNQSPLFDVVTANNQSVGEFLDSDFVGTKIFSYKQGTGKTDPKLGFPLSYRNFNNIGDIQFTNDFDNDSFNYLSSTKTTITEPVNQYFIRKNTSVDSYEFRNVWTENRDLTKQYQLFNYTFTGDTNYFTIDINPVANFNNKNVFVFKNNGTTTELLTDADYEIVTVIGKLAVRVSVDLLTIGDEITIKIYSNSASEIGAYEVPLNLDLNSLNTKFTSLTLGQIRNHLITMGRNNTQIQGPILGENNLRDISISQETGSILQHASPVIYSNLFLLDKNLNFIKSIDYAQKEYSKFKTKFLELAVNTDMVDVTDIPASVDRLLYDINKIKNSTFPWYYSDMVPYGGNMQPMAPYQILNPELRQYEITTVFNDLELSDRAVLVYYATTKKDAYGELVVDRQNNPVITEVRQLIKGRDYYFNQDRPAVTLTDQVTQLYNDLIIIKDYINTNGSYIPETPTKLGLYPKFAPRIFADDSYRDTVDVIQGHDGSITPVFGDYRDQVLLELETRIYNNIKVNYDSTLIDIYEFVPGKFRDTAYSITEFNQIITTAFLKWIGSNRVDYITNTSYNTNDPFTWNYKNFSDTIDGERLPGSWRAVFKYFYDTDRPHQAPWEMLGFSEKPTWWENRYGIAPYTGGNLVLWEDLSRGYIYGEDRVDEHFVRPELLNIIPVDDAGNLRSPEKMLVSRFNSAKTNYSFSVGDIGPTENAWRRSSDYPFALQQAMALMKPGFYFGTLMNVDNYKINSYVNQITLADSQQRISPTAIKINGIVNTVRQRTTGYINWIGDYLTNLGISPGVKIIDALKNLSVQLSYKVAGFTDKNYIRILAEQSSPTSTNQSIIIPNDNYEIFLNKSTPIKKINYSAVIIERSNSGWTVNGYDTENPYFTIIPSLANNNTARLEVGNLVGIVYQDFQKYKIRIPYGYEFTSRQQVIDFLISYGRYLTGQGMRFDTFNTLLESPQDWTLSCREFLTWSQQGWSTGSLLILSPVFNQITVSSTTGTVDFVENGSTGSKILDQEFNVIKNTQFTVTRYGPEFTLATNNNQTIGFAQLNVVQYEHALIFDNTTLFNDIIYTPETGNRQFRLKLVGNRTGSWNGQLDIPGFIYNTGMVDAWSPNTDYKKGSLVSYKNKFYVALSNLIGTVDFSTTQWKQIPESQIKTGLLNNFSYNAQELENIYDINNQPANQAINKFSNGLIGFRERSYLTDLGLNIETQTKFYQGYIKQKGTKNAVNALSTVNLNNIASNITAYEEWALRVGEYGAIDSNDYLEIVLDEQVFNSDPETFVLLNAGDAAPDKIIGVYPSDLYRRPNQYKTDLLTYKPVSTDVAIPMTAGYVNLADIDSTIFNIQNYTDLNSVLGDIGSGYKIWVAKDFTNTWNVYRVTETNNFVTAMTYALNGLALITTYEFHNFVVGDVIAIKNFDSNFDGFYRVFELNDSNSFYVVASKNPAILQQQTTVAGSGLLLHMVSMRATDTQAIIDREPVNHWRNGDRLWVDHAQGEDQWEVYEKRDVWANDGALPLDTADYSTDSGYGSSVKLNSNASSALVGAPAVDKVKIFHRNNETGKFEAGQNIQPLVSNTICPTGNILKFGTSIDSGKDIVAIGAPGALDNRGLVFIYNYNYNDTEAFVQVLRVSDGIADDEYGYSLSMSKDDEWLFVGAPGANHVYSYVLQEFEKYDTLFVLNDGTYTQTASTTVNVFMYQHGLTTGDSITVNPLTGTAVDETVTVTVADSDNFSYTSGSSTTTSGKIRIANYQLSFTPDSIDTISVVGQNYVYVPDIDFTLTNDVITFIGKDDGSHRFTNNDVITVKQGTCYRLFSAGTTPAPAGVSYVRFGHSVKAAGDGSHIIVGAPYSTVDGVNKAGAAVVVNKLVEEFIADGVNNSFVVIRPIVNDEMHFDGRVSVDSVTQRYNVDFTYDSYGVLQFTYTLTAGQIIRVESWDFSIFDVLGREYARQLACFGSSVDICSNTCSAYISAPGYTRPGYRSGQVHRYVNQGRAYGTITGEIAEPFVTANGTYSQADTTVTVTVADHGLISGVSLQSFTLTYQKLNETLTTSGTNAVIQVVDTNTFTFEVIESDTVSGTIESITDQLSSVLTHGDTMFINNIEVQFPDGTVNDLAIEINRKAIPGVTASVVNGQLRIDSQSTVSGNLLDIIPGSGTGSKLTDVGLHIYAHTQIIERPTTATGATFGDSLRISDTGGTLFIGSSLGTILDETSYDGTNTYLDQHSTRIVDVNTGAGTVYVYDYINTANDSIAQPGQFSFVKEISAPESTAGAHFGSSIDIINGVAIIGAQYDSRTQSNAGEAYVYLNDGSLKSWQLIRQNTPKVDTANLNRIFVYNKKTNEIQTTLDLYDPAKGKILGIAEQELDYITSYDPAKYNQNNPVIDTFQPQTAEDFARNPVTFNYVGTTNSWGPEQVGQLWWNLDACRFVDYEQDTLIYRNKNWGKLFPGSVIEICEWVESDLPPGNYTGPGTAKYPDNSTYAISYRVDSATGLIITKYYFWVVNKPTVDTTTSHKTRTAADVANIIESPQNAGVSYAAAISSDAFNLYNINQYISGSDAILQIAYSIVDNQNIIHSEYELIREDTATGRIPDKIVNKMLDSLVGFTINNRTVPDWGIPANQQIGIEHRPMQTMFKNRFDALRTFVDYVNQIIINHPLVLEFDTQKFYEQDPYPTTPGAWQLKTSNYEDLDYIDKSLIPTGYKVLITEDTRYDGLWTISELDSNANFNIVQVQGHRTDFYIDQVDWYDVNFDNTKEVTWTVDTLNDIGPIQSSLTSGDIILVKNEGSGRYAYYEVNTDLTTKLVGLQNGTIQIKNTLYDNTIGNVEFDSDKFDNNRFDQIPTVEIRNIFSAIKDDVFVQSLAVEFNRLFFAIINYLLSEQKTTDWIFKSSFISILHDIRKLEQYPSFVRDNQTYYEEYINEVKPYRTQIREYLLNYQGTDTYGSDITDFSLPARYDSSTGTYRSPTVADFGNVTYMDSLPAAIKAEYQNWYNNYKYQVSHIVLHDPGVGYTIEPDVIITGGGGAGAQATASIWQGNGAIRSFTITNPGSGYTYAPTVTINGNGSRDTGANIQLGFFPNGTIQTATIVNAGSLFTGNPTIFVEGVGTGANLTCSIDTNKGIISKVVIHDGGIGYYSANTQAIVYDPETNAVAVAEIHNVYYSPDPAKSYNTVRTITNKIKFDRTQFTSNVVDWAANVTYYQGDTVRYLGETWRANVATVYPSARIALSSNVTLVAGDTVITYAGNTITGSANVEITVTDSNVVFVTNTVGVLNGGLTYYLGQQTVYEENPEYNTLDIPVVNVTSVFDTTEFIKVPAASLDNAMDRTIGWYAPDRYMAPRDLGQLYAGIDYPGVKVTGLAYNQTVTVDTDQIRFFATNSTIISQDVSKFNFSRLDFKAGQTITVSGAASSGYAEYGNVLTNNRTWFVSTVQDNKISVYYDLPVPAESANVFINLLDEEPDTITITYFNENNPLDLDTTIESSYLDSALGTRPEDIDITGGGFVDTYSSHAPEELIPGRVYDTLNMEVWTQMLSGTANVGYRVFQTMNNDPTTQLILELSEPITVANTYPEPTWIDQVFMNLAAPQGNANVAFGPGVASITSNRIPVWDKYQHDADFYGFVVADDRTVYVNGVDTGATVTGVYKNSWPNYYTINPSNVTVLTQALGIADEEIYVDNAYQLPQGGTNAALPGAVIINGEKIYYYRNYAKDVVPWTPNTVYATDSIVSYLGQEYTAIDTTANLYGATFEFGNVTTINVHRLTRLRRGVEGTGAAMSHPAGSKVVDTSEQQRLTGNVHLTTWLNYTNPYQQDIIDAPGGNDLTAMSDPMSELGQFEAIGTLTGSLTDGTGLEGSGTATALAIKRAAGLSE